MDIVTMNKIYNSLELNIENLSNKRAFSYFSQCECLKEIFMK